MVVVHIVAVVVLAVVLVGNTIEVVAVLELEHDSTAAGVVHFVQ